MLCRVLVVFCFGTLLPVAAGPARADTLDTILDILTKAKVIDPAVKDARPLIECVVNHGPAACVNVQSVAEKEGKAAIKKYTPEDPAIQATVEIVKAAHARDWFKVLEVTGTDLLVQIACKAGLSATGPVGNFLCSSISGEIAKLAKPVIKAAMGAVADGNWPKLIVILGPGLACHLEIIPSAVRSAVCGAIGEILAAGKEIAEGLGEVLVSVGGTVYEAWKNEPAKQSPQQHFKTWWVPEIHRGAWSKFVKGNQALMSVVNKLYDYCKNYYDSSKPCDPMKKTYLDAINPVVTALKAVAPAYYDVHIKPSLLYHYLFYLSSKVQYMGFGWNDGNPCPVEMYKKYPLPVGSSDPGVGVIKGGDPKPTVWAYACKPVETMLKTALTQQKGMLDQKMANLAKKSCTLTSQGTIYCGNYDGHAACQSELAGHENMCSLDQNKAAQTLAADIVKKLGSKRCAAVPSSAAVECTRPWKQQECQALAAPYNKPNLNWKVQCGVKDDAAFNLAKQQSMDLIKVLNSGKWTPPLLSGANTEAMSINFKPAGCKPAWDPVAIICDEKEVVAELAKTVPAVNLGQCSVDPNKDGADTPCYLTPLSIKSVANTPVFSPAKVPLPNTPEAAKRAVTVERGPPEAARGSLPPVVTPDAGRGVPGVPTLKAPPPRTVEAGARVSAASPDITSGGQHSIGGQAVSGAVVNVDASAAHSVNKNNSGLCEFAIKHSARNLGATATGPFDSMWTNSAVPGSFTRSWAPLGPGEMREETDLVNLKPGQNILSLTLDNLNKVSESNEQNNQFRMIVNVSGNCGGANTAPQRGIAPPAAPAVPRAPADQRQQAPIAPNQRRFIPPGR